MFMLNSTTNTVPWDWFLHHFPNLRELNLVFIMQANAFKSNVNFNYRITGHNKQCCCCIDIMNGVSPIRNGVRNIVYCDACVGKNHTVTLSKPLHPLRRYQITYFTVIRSLILQQSCHRETVHFSHTHTHVHIHTCAHTCTNTCTYTHMHTQAQTQRERGPRINSKR